MCDLAVGAASPCMYVAMVKAQCLGIDLLGATGGGVAVPDVVQSDSRKARGGGDAVEPGGDHVRVRWPAVFPAEQQDMVVVVLAAAGPYGVEQWYVGAQQGEGVRVQSDGAAVVVGLPVLRDDPPVDDDACRVHGEGLGVEGEAASGRPRIRCGACRWWFRGPTAGGTGRVLPRGGTL